MKVVQLVTQMESGGAQRVAYLLSEALERRGHESEIWFLYRKRPAYDHLRNVKVLTNSRPRLRLLPRLSSELKERLSHCAPDVLITHTYYANVLGQLHARRLGIRKRIAVQHGLAKDYPAIAKFLDYVVGSTDAYTTNVAVSNAVVASFSSYPSSYLKRLQTISNGIPWVTPTSTRADTRRRWGLPLHAPVMANVGRLSKIKNQTVLLDTLARLPLAHLALIGDGESRQQLRKKAEGLQVSDRLHMFGEVAHEHVVNLIAASDVFVFPSLSESMGLAAVEAMMCGAPIVASDIPAMHEVLGSEAALFATPDDAAALADAVRQIVTTPALANSLSAESTQRACKFTLETMALEYEQLFTAFD